MANYKFDGSYLYTSSNHKIASIKGTVIYDEHNHKVATVKGNDIYDEHNRRFATMNDVKRSIDGAMGGTLIVGLWLFFVR